jgi:hypothetical protein
MTAAASPCLRCLTPDVPTKKSPRWSRPRTSHTNPQIDNFENSTYGGGRWASSVGAAWTSAATQGGSRRPQERVNEAPELRHRREFRAACEAYDVGIIRWHIRINNRLRRTTRTGKFFGHGQKPLIHAARISGRYRSNKMAPTLRQSDVALPPFFSCKDQDNFGAPPDSVSPCLRHATRVEQLGEESGRGSTCSGPTLPRQLGDRGRALIMESDQSLTALSTPQCEVDHIYEVIDVTARTGWRRVQAAARRFLSAAAGPRNSY